MLQWLKKCLKWVLFVWVLIWGLLAYCAIVGDITTLVFNWLNQLTHLYTWYPFNIDGFLKWVARVLMTIPLLKKFKKNFIKNKPDDIKIIERIYNISSFLQLIILSILLPLVVKYLTIGYKFLLRQHKDFETKNNL